MRIERQKTWIISFLVGFSCLNAQPTWADPAIPYREQGIAYRDQGDLPASIAAFQRAVELSPENLEGRVNLGWTLHLAKRDRQSAQVLEQTIPYDPYNIKTFNALGIVYLVNDDLAAAVLTHTWASWLDPNNEIPHYNLSLAYQRLQQFPWAIASAQKAAQLEPDNPHPWVAIAIAQWGQGDRQSALESYREAIALDDRYADRDFLEYLNEAGFSPDQIQLSQQVLAAV
ncbi:MAG: tetratricopeptide repeat protein [Drouetiella hepatica Uher 2000/2452]|jgi:Flp pilus assembly protein TadD|uniref:Tetratricopeptide repeat protein n=1 Tax=Drouetiella hepatica Uher 2000/2452 TaxID=904376 RepID=A0A951UKJ5_9CYAN|nr:tetratricopeptide repeat protein [Drouetiella hepatica Uher 2000/2452]